MKYSSKKVYFLDVDIRKTIRGNFEANLYSKSTDTQQFLRSTSFYRESCKNAIPYSQAIRIN